MKTTRRRSWGELAAIAARLRFESHDIRSQLDATGHYAVELAREFPFNIRLFRYTSRHFTRGPTWHEQLELFLPLDGRVDLRMGEQTAQLAAGDLLIVDNMKPHHVVDHPGFDARVVVISFLPEFVYSLGSPTHDYTFLLPFYSKSERRVQLVPHDDPCAEKLYRVIGQLLASYFLHAPRRYREAACKAWLLVLLHELAERFHDNEIERSEFLRQRHLVRRFEKLFSHLHRAFAEPISLSTAARLAAMSKAQFTRRFRQVAGMNFVAYVTHVRVAEAARLLK
ncbi:MAG TPA: AraC family transcriptional regulator, partial [Chthoniobacteraceae bacterium]|nr:AraC family transcriptional regulator [Chthoniobacteraceae bacterium]